MQINAFIYTKRVRRSLNAGNIRKKVKKMNKNKKQEKNQLNQNLIKLSANIFYRIIVQKLHANSLMNERFEMII